MQHNLGDLEPSSWISFEFKDIDCYGEHVAKNILPAVKDFSFLTLVMPFSPKSTEDRN